TVSTSSYLSRSLFLGFIFSSRRRHTRSKRDWSSDVCSSDLFHAVTGPGGGAEVTQVAPGQTKSFTFKAMKPGLFVYHCATPMVRSEERRVGKECKAGWAGHE